MTQEQLQDTTNYLREKGFTQPEVGIVLGTGLGKLAEDIQNPVTVLYSEIPFFPLPTVEFHSGKLIYGEIEKKKVIVMQGRFHLYEGYNFTEITYPIRVMHKLGIKKLLISNAAGAVNLNFEKGNLMLIEDHINLQGGSPLAFKNVGEFGERFTDMSRPYDTAMQQKILDIARALSIPIRTGVYAAVTGPQLETRAEYRYLKIIGADAVGMSTVPEVIVANHLHLPVAAVSVLTDECDPDHLQPVDIKDILAVAAKAEQKLIPLFKTYIKSM